MLIFGLFCGLGGRGLWVLEFFNWLVMSCQLVHNCHSHSGKRDFLTGLSFSVQQPPKNNEASQQMQKKKGGWTEGIKSRVIFLAN